MRKTTSIYRRLSIWILLIVGASVMKWSSNNGPLEGWQAIYMNPDGTNWTGPVRDISEQALGDAESHMATHPEREGHVVVMRVGKEGLTPSLMSGFPPNPVASRKLQVQISLKTVVGKWEILKRGMYKDDQGDHYLEFFRSGEAATNIDWPRWGETDEPDSWEIMNDSTLGLSVSGGGLQVFSVMAFDGETMEIYLDGHKDQPISLRRIEDDTDEPDVIPFRR